MQPMQHIEDDDTEHFSGDFPSTSAAAAAAASLSNRKFQSRDNAREKVRPSSLEEMYGEPLLTPACGGSGRDITTNMQNRTDSQKGSIPSFAGVALVAAAAHRRRRSSTSSLHSKEETASLNTAGNGSQSNEVHDSSIGIHSHGQLGTDFMRNVPQVPGVPQNVVRSGNTMFSLIGLLFLIVATIGWARRWYGENVYVEEMNLDRGVDVSLSLKNCAVDFVESNRNYSYVKVEAWMQMRIPRQNKMPVFRRGQDASVHILLHMSSYDPFYKCLLKFNLTPDFYFGSLTMMFVPADRYVRVDADVPVKARDSLMLEAFHAYVSFQSVEAKSASFSLGAGHLNLAFDGPAKSYSNMPISIISRTAAISISSVYPLSISMDADTARSSLFRATGRISVSPDVANGDQEVSVSALLQPAEVSSIFAGLMSIKVNIDAELSSVYATSRGIGEDVSQPMHTWVGKEHQEKPHLDPYSLQRFESALQWLSEDASAPWVIVIEQVGIFNTGNWKVLSSNAYLRAVYWFVVLSGGMLQPRILHLPLHMRGLFCRGYMGEESETFPEIVTSSEDSLLQSFMNFFLPKEEIKSLRSRGKNLRAPSFESESAPMDIMRQSTDNGSSSTTSTETTNHEKASTVDKSPLFSASMKYLSFFNTKFWRRHLQPYQQSVPDSATSERDGFGVSPLDAASNISGGDVDSLNKQVRPELSVL